MLERIKTVVLTILVLISIILTARLFFGVPPLETANPPEYEQLIFGELREPESQVLPSLSLESDAGIYQLEPWHPAFVAAWEEMKALIKRCRLTNTAEQLPDIPGDRLVRATFPVVTPAEIWGNNSLNDLTVEQIIWYENLPGVLWLGEGGDFWSVAALGSGTEDLFAALAAGFAEAPFMQRPAETALQEYGIAAGSGLVLPAEPILMAPRVVSAENLDREKLVRSIFVDLALVRTIEERDGALIYTDGQKGLRIFDYGEIEYSAPKSEPGLEAMEKVTALRRTAQFLQLLGGWPDHLYIKSLDQRKKPLPARRHWDLYEIVFMSAQHGYPLVFSRPPAELRFTDRGVVYFRRQILSLGVAADEERALMDPWAAIAEALQHVEQDNDTITLEAVYPVYFLRGSGRPPSFALPAWALQFEKETLYLHGFSGILLGRVPEGV